MRKMLATPTNDKTFCVFCFSLNSHSWPATFCNSTTDKVYPLSPGNIKTSAEFYVFVGVMAFLYSLAAVILYVVFDDKYRKYDLIPIAVSIAGQ